MTKYRLKKDLPGIDAGAIVQTSGLAWSVNDKPYCETRAAVEDALDAALELGGWLEPIEEMTEEKAIDIIADAIRNRWKPGMRGTFFKVERTASPTPGGASGIYKCIDEEWFGHSFNLDKYAHGNCFKTREEAERYAEALQYLLDNEPKND